jgi:hypothetical protein
MNLAKAMGKVNGFNAQVVPHFEKSGNNAASATQSLPP